MESCSELSYAPPWANPNTKPFGLNPLGAEVSFQGAPRPSYHYHVPEALAALMSLSTCLTLCLAAQDPVLTVRSDGVAAQDSSLKHDC